MMRLADLPPVRAVIATRRLRDKERARQAASASLASAVCFRNLCADHRLDLGCVVAGFGQDLPRVLA